MILPEHVERACAELVEEHHHVDLLRSYNLFPRKRVLKPLRQSRILIGVSGPSRR